MAIRGTNIFALLQDSDDEEKPRPSPAPVVSVKQSKPAATVPAPVKKQEPRVVEEAPSDPPQKESKRVEKKQKPVLDDRHSKTGRGKEMKKDGQGSHNWGSDVQTRGKGTNAGGGRDKPEKIDPTADLDAEVPPEPVEEEEAEKPAEASAEAPAEGKKEASKPEEPEYIRRRREQEEADERARKEAESYRTYKEFLGAAETSEEKPKTQTLLAFKGMEGEGRRGGRGRGRGRGKPETESRPKAYVPDLGDFPKLG